MSPSADSTASTIAARHRSPALLFGLTLFLSAFLLFSIQPMFAKILLPLLGGAPAVWNTCLVFFQMMLLAGYGYAYLVTGRLNARTQVILHALAVLLPLAVLPIAIPAGWNPPTEANPIPWLLALLLTAAGLPFFVVATSAPLLQSWFAHTAHPDAHDPYFLYAASNAGSLTALLSYPTLIEPHLRLAQQSRAWAIGYGALVLLLAGCAWVLRRAPTRHAPLAHTVPLEYNARVTMRQRVGWVVWSLIPSSLLMGVTTYLSTDIAAIPLLWILPLALYLLTFILVFAQRPPLSHVVMVKLLPLAVLPLAMMMVCRFKISFWLLLALHLCVFFVIAIVCHGALACRRPAARHLAEFYLWLACGGMLGGGFNALLAPRLFSTIAEYPLMIVLACLLCPPPAAQARARFHWMDLALPCAVGFVHWELATRVQAISVEPSWLRVGLLYAVPVLACFVFRYRPVRFGLGIGLLLWISARTSDEWRHVVYVQRSFFGVYRILYLPGRGGPYFALVHGTTLHGTQSLAPSRRHEPLTYYHTASPIGQLLAAPHDAAALAHIAVIGLGTGSLASYGEPNQQWTLYEIDPVVKHLASDPRCFTFLSDSRARWRVVLGDGRRSLAQAPNGRYDLIVVDAFSSDAIPVHLLTREAIQLYLTKLTDHGLLAFHVSNGRLKLQPILGDVSGASGLVALTQFQKAGPEEHALGKLSSEWVVMARRVADLGRLAADGRWQRLVARPGATVWTDDYSNILSICRWR